MPGIVAAMDMSGNPVDGYKTFLAVVIGLDEYVRSVVESVGYEHIHMRTMNRKEQERVARRLKLNRTECVALCVRTDGTHTVDRIANAKKMKKHRFIRGRIVRAHNRLVFAEIREALAAFSLKHGLSLSDVVFECDSDCLGLAKDAGLRYTRIKSGSKSNAHMVADYVAWSNNKRMEPDNTVVVDVARRVGDRLAKIFSV